MLSNQALILLCVSQGASYIASYTGSEINQDSGKLTAAALYRTTL